MRGREKGERKGRGETGEKRKWKILAEEKMETKSRNRRSEYARKKRKGREEEHE